MGDSPLSSLVRTALHRTSFLRTTLGVLVVALAIAPAAAARPHGDKPARSSQAACPSANGATSDARQLQKAMFCLHNLERRRRGLSQLRWSGTLAGVARAHARDMVSRHYFAHVSPGGKDHMDRLAAGGYQPDVGCWTAGENLLSGGAASPRQLLGVWMHSPLHRENILRRSWRGFGLGVAPATPEGDANGVTLVALFGARSRQLCR